MTTSRWLDLFIFSVCKSLMRQFKGRKVGLKCSDCGWGSNVVRGVDAAGCGWATTHTVPSCLVVSAHTGPSLPPAPQLSASAAALLEANPAEKGQTQTFTSPVLPELPAAMSTGMHRLFYQERPTWGYSHMCWQPVQLRRSPRAGQEQVLIQ